MFSLDRLDNGLLIGAMVALFAAMLARDGKWLHPLHRAEFKWKAYQFVSAVRIQEYFGSH
jgi:hypothetical protein